MDKAITINSWNVGELVKKPIFVKLILTSTYVSRDNEMNPPAIIMKGSFALSIIINNIFFSRMLEWYQLLI